MLKTLTGNKDQLWAQLTTLFAVGGPVASILLMYGLPADQVTGWMKLIDALLVIVPLIAKIVHDRRANSDAAITLAASKVPSVRVAVDTKTAHPDVAAVANDDTNNVKVAA